MIHQGKIVVCCQGLIGGREKRIIGLLEGPGIWTLDSRFKERSTTNHENLTFQTTVQSHKRMCRFFCLATLSHTRLHTEWDRSCAVPWRPPRWCLTTAVVVRNLHRATYSRPTCNKRMVLLKLNLFILNINSSPFSAMLFLIPSMPLLTNQLLISQLSTNNNPTMPESLHESINQRYWPQFDFASGCCCCCCWLCLPSIHCLFLDVMNNVHEFPSLVKEQRQHQRSAAT